MFHTSRNFSAHLTNFLPYQDGVKMIEEINKILRETAFPNRQCNLLMLLCIILSFTSPFPSLYSLFSSEPGKGSVSLGPLFAGMFLPYVLYFSLMIYKKKIGRASCRERV